MGVTISNVMDLGAFFAMKIAGSTRVPAGGVIRGAHQVASLRVPMKWSP